MLIRRGSCLAATRTIETTTLLQERRLELHQRMRDDPARKLRRCRSPRPSDFRERGLFLRTVVLRGKGEERGGRDHGRQGGSDQAVVVYRDSGEEGVGHQRYGAVGWAAQGWSAVDMSIPSWLRADFRPPSSSPNTVLLTGVPIRKVSIPREGSSAKPCRSSIDISLSDCSRGCRGRSTNDLPLTRVGTSSVSDVR